MTDQTRYESHGNFVDTINGGHTPAGTVGDGAGLVPPGEFAGPVNEIVAQVRQRRVWIGAERSLTLRIKAMCRSAVGGDLKDANALYVALMALLDGRPGSHPLARDVLPAVMPLVEARAQLEKPRAAIELRLKKIVRTLPIWTEWAADIRGVAELSIASIIGEAGDLNNYTNPAKLWKRMGLGLIVNEKGERVRQRKVRGVDALDHGYNPERRAVMWVIGDCIIKAGGGYKEVYDGRKVYELPRVKTKGHAHNRAKRYMEKRLLRDMWEVWTGKVYEYDGTA